jgi:hypothetical protein
MANATINIPKSHLIMGLSLPLAVLLGYFLAEPLELGSMAVVLAVLAVLCVPLLMRWYHPLLVLSWNSMVTPVVLPGRTTLWMVVAAVGLMIAVLGRAINRDVRFIHVPPVAYSLLSLAAVVVATALLRGNVGIRSLGSSQYGGGKYVELLMGIAAYFALTSRRIPPHRANLYAGLFFLSGIAYAAANLMVLASSKFSFLLNIFPIGQSQLSSYGSPTSGMLRLSSMVVGATAFYSYMLARFGIRGLMDMGRPWRLTIFVLVLPVGLLGGFRGYVGLFALTFAVLFLLEGLHRTRYLAIGLVVLVIGSLVVLPQGDRLPLVAQRALSFLPGRFDSFAVDSAQATIGWRVEMWKLVLPDVPKYLFRGKGYVLDPTDLYLAGEAEHRFSSEYAAGTIVAGDYHNGPLSVLIPFGIYGMIAFIWFLIAGTRTLYRNYKFGNPAYRTINGLLLASFIVREFWFFTFFGGLAGDIWVLGGFVGFGVALNGTDAAEPALAKQTEVAMEPNTQYIRA